MKTVLIVIISLICFVSCEQRDCSKRDKTRELYSCKTEVSGSGTYCGSAYPAAVRLGDPYATHMDGCAVDYGSIVSKSCSSDARIICTNQLDTGLLYQTWLSCEYYYDLEGGVLVPDGGTCNIIMDTRMYDHRIMRWNLADTCNGTYSLSCSKLDGS